MRVLVGCEESGTVRDAFIARGHDAVSVDILPSRAPGPHIQTTILDHQLYNGTHGEWDAGIFFPDCTFLCGSGARWNAAKWRTEAQWSAVYFVRSLWALLINGVAIENPVGRLSTLWIKPKQIIQPWQFGDPECKATCLWLRGLPKLEPTNIVPKSDRLASVHHMPPGPNRKRDRAKTFQGIADAMAEQWGSMNTDLFALTDDAQPGAAS